MRLRFTLWASSRRPPLFTYRKQVEKISNIRLKSRMSTTLEQPTAERKAELTESLAEISARVEAAASLSSPPTLVAVSKYKPASDILACHELGQLDFGENYVQELEDKARIVSLLARAKMKSWPADREDGLASQRH